MLEGDWRGLASRILGYPELAQPYHSRLLFQGECFLARGEFEKAEQALRQALEEHDCPQVSDALGDCLLFSGRGQRREGVELKEKAASLVCGVTPRLQSLFGEDLAALHRAVHSLPQWAGYRARLAAAPSVGDQEVAALDSHLSQAKRKLARGSIGAVVTMKSLVLRAERALPYRHPAAAAVRSRAVHALRSFGYWKEADDLVARGHVLERFVIGSGAPESTLKVP